MQLSNCRSVQILLFFYDAASSTLFFSSTGYTLSHSNVVYSHSPDKNECEEEGEGEGEGEGGEDKPLCKEGTYCHNTPGSYRCNGEGMQ